MAVKRPKRSKHKKPPAWHMYWRLIKDLVWEAFSDEDAYFYARYGKWEDRIKAGHDADEGWLKERLAEWEKKIANSSDPERALYEAGDWASDIHAETCGITSRMYAALVVSIWADVEHLLRSVVGCCQVATGKRKKDIANAKTLCKEFSEGKTTDAQRRACIGALKEIEASIPRNFADFKDLLKTEGGVVLAGCERFHIVNAIRVLSNCYKHSNGCYVCEGNRTHADTALAQFRRWGVLDERDKIDYSKLPIQELVVACNTFCNDVLDKVKARLDKRTS